MDKVTCVDYKYFFQNFFVKLTCTVLLQSKVRMIIRLVKSQELSEELDDEQLESFGHCVLRGRVSTRPVIVVSFGLEWRYYDLERE